MSKIEKLIQKIFDHQQVSYNDAEKILLGLGYEVRLEGPIMFLEKMAIGM